MRCIRVTQQQIAEIGLSGVLFGDGDVLLEPQQDCKAVALDLTGGYAGMLSANEWKAVLEYFNLAG